jgi:hypothetical protein
MKIPITTAREHVCSALADIGGICERLRELEEGNTACAAESWEDIANWVANARLALDYVRAEAENHFDAQEGAK